MPSASAPAAVMLELAPLPAAPQATPFEAPAARELSAAVPEPQEPPPVDLKPMKIEVETAEPPPPVKLPLAEVVLPEPEPPPPLELKPPANKPKAAPAKLVEKPKPPQPRSSSLAAASPSAPEQTPVAAAPAPAAAASPPSASLPNWKGVSLRISSGTSAIPRKHNARAAKVSLRCASP